jgi:hypothetical protein
MYKLWLFKDNEFPADGEEFCKIELFTTTAMRTSSPSEADGTHKFMFTTE